MSVVIVALCMFDHMFFSASPPLAPSASASTKRDINILKDGWKLLRNPNFVVLALCYGVPQGTYSGWSGVLDPILAPLHFSQSTVNWLGFASTVGAVVGGVAFGSIADHVKRVKWVIVGLCAASTLLGGWFTLIANRILPQSNWQLFLSCTVGRY